MKGFKVVCSVPTDDILLSCGNDKCVEVISASKESLRELNAKLLSIQSDVAHCLSDELIRRRLTVQASKEINALLLSTFGPSCSTAGIFPSLVFEGLSSAERERADPLLSSSCHFPGGVSTSVGKRLTTMCHDLLHLKGEEALARSSQISRTCCEILSRHSFLCQKERSSVTVPMNVMRQSECGSVYLSCGDHCHSILCAHYAKLVELFTGSSEEMDGRIFVLLERYAALGGDADPLSERGWHGSVPSRVLSSLRESLQLNCECFASPFNTFSSFYCSAFPDTDCYFGSVGNFFQNNFVQGTFEANPPFDHSVVLALARRANELLSASELPLCFVVFVPIADNGKQLTSSLAFDSELRNGGFLVADQLIKGSAAPYVDGGQQCRGSALFVTRFSTQLFVLQNPSHAITFNATKAIAAAVHSWAEIDTSSFKKRERDP